MSMLDEVGNYLEAQGIGTQGIDLFLGELPDAPAACVAVHEYAGLPTIKAMGITAGGAIAEQPRLQVIARAATYAAARAKAKEIFSKLDGHSGTLGGTEYLFIAALQSPFLLQRDENDRVLIAFNCEVTKRLS